MSLTDVLLLFVIICLAYIAITVKLVGAAVERIAGVSHYQQQSPFKPDIRAMRVPKTSTEPVRDTRAVTSSTLVDITDLPEEEALKALENWGNE
jgi:hypothetical protein